MQMRHQIVRLVPYVQFCEKDPLSDLSANAAAERRLTKRGVKDKPSSQIADPAVPSRRSQQLNKALQNGLMYFVPLCPVP